MPDATGDNVVSSRSQELGQSVEPLKGVSYSTGVKNSLSGDRRS